ncbi:MAG TPA: protein kinase, partial [Candidatus Wallbacteria bacterium]|nr:protein kinase [Candidatus Wallbacteria bacterium]
NAALEALLPHANGYFDEAVRLGNKKVILLYGGCVIDSYNRQKNVNAAIAAIDKILAIFPKEKSLLKKKAFLLLEKGEEANIVEIFKELYESNPNDIKVKTEYCRLLQKIKKTDECIVIILDALRKNETPEKFIEIFIALCGDLIKSRQFSKAIESADQVYEITKSSGVFLVVAEACLKSGDIDRACDIYTKLSVEKPDSESVLKRLKYVRSLVEERKLSAMKDEGADNITLLIDGENVIVKKLQGESGPGRAANPVEIKMAEAKLYFERSEYRKAIPVFQELSKLLDGKKEGLIVQIYLITCFLRENLSAAAEKIYDSIDPSRLGLSAKEELSFKYKAAGLFEEGRDLKKAEAVFSDVISIDMGYRDAGDRLNGVKEKIGLALAASARIVSASVEDDSEKTTIGMVLTEADYIDKRYQIISQLGKGGMGIVFKANDTVENREVAIKIPILSFKDDKGFMDRFEREASVLKKLKHPNIMNIFSVEGRELPYIVMEILAGRSLKEIIKEKKIIQTGETRDLAIQCCDALAYTHGLNIVHRDIKPENIMVIKDGVVKIMDFGLAKALDESTVTKAGTILGTFAYISPEQAMGGAVDGRSDIYSLGVMFYEMLAGEKPFTSGDFVHQHLKVKPVPPTKKNGKIPYQVEAIVLKCLEKEPANRFKNMEELKEAWTKII